MTRYRLVIFGKPRRWRRSREEAEQEAINAGMASRETWRPHRVYLSAGAAIEREE